MYFVIDGDGKEVTRYISSSLSEDVEEEVWTEEDDYGYAHDTDELWIGSEHAGFDDTYYIWRIETDLILCYDWSMLPVALVHMVYFAQKKQTDLLLPDKEVPTLYLLRDFYI